MAGGAQPVLWGSLPDELWIKVFGAVDFSHRHGSLALVCRRWAQLVCSPALLLHVQSPELPCSAARLRAFCAWVVRRGLRHVRRLKLRLEHDENTTDDLLATAAATAAACCAAGALEELAMHVSAGSLELGWVAPLTSLTRLDIDTYDGCEVRILGSMRHLTRLQELSLDGSPVVAWDPEAHLPSSLTLVHLNNTDYGMSLRQLASLSRLERLHMSVVRCDSADYEWLPRLTALTDLRMSECDALPGGLGELTWLRGLELKDTPCSDEDNLFYGSDAELQRQLQASLAPLTGLTHLVLDSLAYFDGWPAAITGMTALHSLLSWDLPVDAPMPPGAYLRGLRRLALPAKAAGLSLGALTATEQLQELELYWRVSGAPGLAVASEPALAALRWAARHPSLRRLCMCMGGANQGVPPDLLDAVAQAQRTNPSLHIHSCSSLHAGLLRGTRADS